MKNKKTSWILLPAVLAIWGFLGWKLYAAMKDEAPQANYISPHIAAPDDQLVPDTYQLLLDYPDPFLTIPKPSPKQSSNVNSQTPKQVIPKTETIASLPWPEIRYAGLVKSPKDGKAVGFLTINGISHFVKNGDVVDLISVKTIWKDSVLVAFGKESEIIRK